MHSDSLAGEPRPRYPAVRMFSWAIRFVWILLFCLLLVSELVPRPLFAPLMYYSYSSAKAIMFLLLGFTTPLAFWRFDHLGWGVFFAVAAAGAAESAQSLLEGHRSSFAEFLLKLVLLLIGFACALNSRYDRRIGVGRYGVRLLDTHFSQPD
jgi:hypothetical protein